MEMGRVRVGEHLSLRERVWFCQASEGEGEDGRQRVRGSH